MCEFKLCRNVGRSITHFLKSCQRPNGTLYDEIDQGITPDNHYAHTFHSLALIQLYQLTNDITYLRSAEKALIYYFALPEKKRGHRELNNLAVLWIRSKFGNQLAEMKVNLEDRIEEYIGNMKFDSDLTENLSNNWTAIKAGCYALRYSILSLLEDRAEAKRLMHNFVLRCQLDDGLFYDWPPRAMAESCATPLAYHAKICMMLLEYYKCLREKPVLKAAVKGLRALSHFIAEDGETFYFGRSNNALFGYASAIYAYEEASSLLNREKQEASQFRICAGRLLDFITKWQSQDGHISITPNGEERIKCGWDEYMHNTVYNAYAAALLLMLPNKNTLKEKKTSIKPEENFYAEHSGLLVIRRRNFFLCLSTHGQSIPHDTLFSDSRYYGMNIQCLKIRGIDIVPSPPCFITPLRNRLNPALAGFLPYIKVKSEVYSPRTWDKVKVEFYDNSVQVLAEGFPVTYKLKRIYEFVRGRRILHDVYKRYLNSRETAYNEKILAESIFYRAVVVLPSEAIIMFLDAIKGPERKAVIGSISARFNTKKVSVSENKIISSVRDFNTVLESIHPQELTDVSVTPVPTSKGTALVVSNPIDINLPEEHFSACALYPMPHSPNEWESPHFSCNTIAPLKYEIEISTKSRNHKFAADFADDLRS